MHPRIYKEFERICSARQLAGRVLEIGSTPTDQSLLSMPCLRNTERVGLDYTGPHEMLGYQIVKGNANQMEFADESFDIVLCNAVMEHDRYFWKTFAEIKRVAKPGGFIAVGVPGYSRVRGKFIKAILNRLPLVRRFRNHQYFNALFISTLTYEIHNWPGDYYRFSPQAMREVILEGLEGVEVCTVMLPPRVIGWGVKPRLPDSRLPISTHPVSSAVRTPI